LFDKLTLFQQTIKRVRDIVPLSKIYVITNKQYVRDIQRQLPVISSKNIIAEPEKKNTAMAMGVAAAWIYKKDPKAVIINLATDHLIKKPVSYRKTLLAAAKAAYIQNKLVAVGIVPTFPHTGLGYIKVGSKIKNGTSLPSYKMEGFTEKPDKQKAARFLKSGKYLWNANNYVFPANLVLEEFKKHAPDIFKNINRIYHSIGTATQSKTIKQEYAKVRDDSIDYAISEKTSQMIVMPGDFGWDDVGDWRVVYDLSKKDKKNNAVISHGQDGGGYLGLDSSNNLVQFNDQLIVTIGVDNLVIVDTEDVLLVCNKSRAEDVKQIVNTLKEKKLDQYI